MSGTDRLRAALIATGVLVGLYGGWLLVSRQGLGSNVSVLTWAAGGVVVHDGLVAAGSLLAGLVVGRVAPRPARAPLAVGGVVLASVTLLAIPVLGRFGALEDNPTLLDRDYRAGWLVLAGVVVLAVVVASLWRARPGAVRTSEDAVASGSPTEREAD